MIIYLVENVSQKPRNSLMRGRVRWMYVPLSSPSFYSAANLGKKCKKNKKNVK